MGARAEGDRHRGVPEALRDDLRLTPAASGRAHPTTPSLLARRRRPSRAGGRVRRRPMVGQEVKRICRGAGCRRMRSWSASAQVRCPSAETTISPTRDESLTRLSSLGELLNQFRRIGIVLNPPPLSTQMSCGDCAMPRLRVASLCRMRLR
jgi:hypothetical protein